MINIINKYSVNIISFCLYGDSDKYYLPLLNSLIYIKNFHSKTLQAIVNISDDYPISKIKEIESLGAKIILIKFTSTSTEKRLSRLNPILLNLGSACFMRDSDSEFGEKDVTLIDDFLISSSSFQVVRDHPNHRMPIMAGLWGVKRSGYDQLRGIWPEVQRHKLFRTDSYRSDEIILADLFYPKTIKNTLIYTDFNIYLNEVGKRVSVKKIFPENKVNFLGRIAPRFNPEDENAIKIYLRGKLRLLLPYLFLKIFRYRYIFRLSMMISNKSL